MDELISVVVPIYNVAPYLEKCVESILHQTYKNIEIILVDDGSTDGSSEICDDFKLKDDRVKVIHQENRGVTSARKAGIAAASGVYIGFVDADDWIEKEMYGELYRYIKRDCSQVVASGVYRDNEEGTYAKWPAADIDIGVYSGNEKKEKLDVKIFSVNGCLNYKLFEAGLIKHNLEKVDNRIHYAEDTACTLPCILEADTVTIIDEAFYHGFERSNSATHCKHEDWYEQLNLVFLRLKEAFQGYSYSEKLLHQLQEYTISNIIAGITHLFPTAHVQRYFWSEDSICEKKRVIIYGAGAVGQSYLEQFNRMTQYDVVLWVDINSDYYKRNGFSVSGIEQIPLVEFDEIIIALKRREVAEDVTAKLIACGVYEEQIKWKRPISLYEYLGGIE